MTRRTPPGSGVPAGALQAVLFDMDGTLVDSEKLWQVALDELAAHFGGELSTATRAAMIGTNMAVSMGLFHADLGLDGDLAESQRLLEARTKELFALGLPWRVGAQELLHEVRAAGLPTALVTATHRHLVEVALTTLGPEHFDVVVCGDEVTRSKPHPDPYLQAVRLLGVDPAHCVAIEDSPTGATAAEAAGCAVLAVPSEVPVPPGKRRTVRQSLAEVDVAYLRGLLLTA
ncbi:MAG TPA: HAD family phosphatase [Nocardioides sp.]|jgi:HAD superfamily hydrolase (TIGR01509 family)